MPTNNPSPPAEAAGVVVVPGFFPLTISGYVALVNVAHISQVAEQKSGGTLLVLTASDGGHIPNHIKTNQPLSAVAELIAAALSPVKAGGVVTGEALEAAREQVAYLESVVFDDDPSGKSAISYLFDLLDKLEATDAR